MTCEYYKDSQQKGIKTCEYHTEIRGVWRGGGGGDKGKERTKKMKNIKTKNFKNSRAGSITNALNFDHIS